MSAALVEKNQKALMRIFANVKVESNWILEFVGDGPDRKLLEQCAKRLNLDQVVRFIGQRDDVETLLAESSIFAFTSLTEGFPTL